MLAFGEKLRKLIEAEIGAVAIACWMQTIARVTRVMRSFMLKVCLVLGLFCEKAKDV
jgi:hypothetical protein